MRRKYPRKRRRLAVQWGIDEVQWRGFTTDLSLSGMGVRTNRFVPPGTEILLHFDMDGTSCTAHGTVRWVRQGSYRLAHLIPNMMGIEFTSCSEDFVRYFQT
jgi:hypothetical protein